MGIDVQRDTKHESGGALATLPELAAMLGLSGGSIRGVLFRAGVRYVEGPPARYPIAAVRAAVEPHRAELEAQRERGVAQQAAEKAAADVRRAERAAQHAKVMASNAKGATATVGRSKQATPAHTSAFPPRSLGNPSSSRPDPPRRPEPEVFIMRRRPVPTP
jgi:hypothetical protein